MSNTQKLINFLKNNNGYVATSDFLNMGISKPLIQNFVDDGLIRKVSHGLYIDNYLIEDEYYIIQKKYSNVVFSYNTAFYILNLISEVPSDIDITTIRGKRIIGNYNIHYVTEKNFEIGLVEVLSPFGNPVKVYNAERSICDMLKSENQFNLELQNKILDYYFNSNSKNIDKLIEYSKKFNIYEKVKTIVEVMLK